MVLIIPWFLSIVGGRVNIDPKTGRPNYKAPKLNPPNFYHLTETGVVISPEVRKTSFMVLLTATSYLLLQVPGLVYLNASPEKQAKGEKNWALLGLILCVCFFILYLYQQYSKSDDEDTTQQDSRDEYLRKAIAQKKITLAGVMTLEMEKYEEDERTGRYRASSNASYQDGKQSELAPLRGVSQQMSRQKSSAAGDVSERFIEHLKKILKPFFTAYDVSNSGSLKTQDLLAVFRDMGEHLTSEQLDSIFAEYDSDGNGVIDYNEFVRGTAKYLHTHREVVQRYSQLRSAHLHAAHERLLEKPMGGEEVTSEAGDEEEEEDIPDDLKQLSPEDQQKQIKWRAFWMMAVGSLIVLIISDPMVDCLSEVGNRTGIPAFYIAFVVAPLASNATELIAAYNYSLKKTPTSITVSLTTLEGAAIMNNTFVLGVFMALVYFKGLVWQYFAETLSILAVELIMIYFAATKTKHTIFDAYLILAMYPLSLALVAFLEYVGWN